MDDRLIRLARTLIRDVLSPLVGLGGLIFLLSTPDAPERPTLVAACLVLIGYPIAGRADRKAANDEQRQDYNRQKRDDRPAPDVDRWEAP